MHCVHSNPVLSISQMTKAATEEWIRAVSADSHHTLLSRAGTNTGCSGLSGNWSWGCFWSSSSPGACSGEGIYSSVLLLLPQLLTASAGTGSSSLPSEPSITCTVSEYWKSVLNSPWNRDLENWTHSNSVPLYPRDFWLLRYHMHFKKGERAKNKSITSNRKSYFCLCLLHKSHKH